MLQSSHQTRPASAVHHASVPPLVSRAKRFFRFPVCDTPDLFGSQETQSIPFHFESFSHYVAPEFHDLLIDLGQFRLVNLSGQKP